MPECTKIYDLELHSHDAAATGARDVNSRTYDFNLYVIVAVLFAGDRLRFAHRLYVCPHFSPFVHNNLMQLC